MSKQDKKIINQALTGVYRAGFISKIKTETAPRGLNEDIIRLISQKKEEPRFMLDLRLKAYRHWLRQAEPTWASVKYDPIDYQNIIYYAAPQEKKSLASLDEVDPKVRKTFTRLGISLDEQKRLSGVAIDAVLDSVSVATTFKKELARLGIIFCPMNEAIKKHPALIKKYFGSVVSYADNFFSALNAAVFTDGSFVYIPPGVECPLELSTYFRINAAGTGQFERTLIIADKNSRVSYLEGCTAPARSEHQLHAAVVEIIALDNAEVKYATVQNWYPGEADGRGGVYNFVTKRGVCRGKNSKISWTQVETGSAITWKYPSVILLGDNSRGEFYSVAVTKNKQQADTGSKMIHLGKRTSSVIIAKGIAAGESSNSYRGLVSIGVKAKGARNFSQCDSLILGSGARAHTFPRIESAVQSSLIEHEASATKISAEELFYCQSRGLGGEQAKQLIVNGFVSDVFKRLPMEFAVEAKNLLTLTLADASG